MGKASTAPLDDGFKRRPRTWPAGSPTTTSFTAAEIAEVIGSAAEYKVSEAADRNAGVVLKINKERLRGLGAP